MGFQCDKPISCQVCRGKCIFIGDAENTQPGKCQYRKCTEWKVLEFKMHTLKNYRKFTPSKMAEELHLENGRLKLANPGK